MCTPATPSSLTPPPSRRGASRAFLGLAAALLIAGAGCDGNSSEPLPDLTVSPDSVLLQQEASVQLTARGARSTVSWTSSDEAVATVVSTGFVTAAGPGTAIITATAGTQSGAAKIVVIRRPALALSTQAVSFAATAGAGDPAAQTVSVTNAGDGTLGGLTASVIHPEGQPEGWLSATLEQGTAPATLTLRATTGSLPPGSYTASVQVTSPVASNGTQAIAVGFTVEAPPAIALSSASVSFSATAGGGDPTPQTVNVGNSGGGTLAGLAATVSYASGQPAGWLQATLDRTTAPATLTLSPGTGSLAAGSYSATVQLAAPGASNSPQSVAVTFTVSAGASIVLSRTNVNFGAPPGGPNPAAQTVNVTNGGGGTLSGLTRTISYGTGQPTGWLTASFDRSTAPAVLTLQAAAGSLAPGTYSATVSVGSSQAGVAPQAIAVTLAISTAPVIQLSASSASFSATRGSAATPASVPISVTNSGAGTLSGLGTSISYGSGQPTGWLSAPLSGTSAPATITLQASTGSLPGGTYTATVTVSSSVPGVVSRTINVTFTVQQPQIGLSTTSAAFTATRGSAATPVSQTISVSNSGAGLLSGLTTSISYGSGQPAGWLSASLSGTSAPASLTLQANTGSLPGGTYTATVTVSSTVPGVTARTVNVTFTVNQPQIGLSASSSAFPGAGDPARDTIDVNNAGAGTLSGLVATVGSGASWLTASLSQTTAPAKLRLQVTPGTLPVGTHTAAVTVSSSVPGVTPQVVSVSYTIRVSYASQIQPILNSGTCTGCHTGAGAAGQLDLTGDPFSRLVNVPSAGYAPRLRVDPFNPHPNSSILICKIQKGGEFGGYTPCGSINMGNLSTAQIDLVYKWIQDGAPRN